MQLDEASESALEFILGAGLQDGEPQPLAARRFLHLAYHTLALWIVRVNEHCDHAGLRNQLEQQLEPLRHQLDGNYGDPRHVAAWPGEAGDQPVRDRVAAADENDRDRRGCVFRRACGNGAADCYDRVDLTTDEIAGQLGQPIVTTLRPAVFDRDILSLDITGFAQPLVERGRIRCKLAGRGAAEETDHRHRLLLRADGAWRRHRAAQEEQ